MTDHNDRRRMSDEELQRFADNILYDYELETRNGGVFVVSPTPLAVRELVLRELERRKKEDRGDGDD